ncbi:site-specific integrase [Lichenicoccus roseus]|uniref:Integrase n=1 Tax=Lichenicoccus roseus TaxID=2683649 RepID=A0A5R9IYW4_9PROT|nr:hypothetical protein [Lichenicoccus roseus]TLU70674.1 hypothetical protein FE263_21030 [Lichenicoccus roseus]
MTAATAEPQNGQHIPRVAVLADPAPTLLKPETRRLYATDWAAFALWCRNGDQTALPADAATLAAYLQDQAMRLGPGALARRLAAIVDQHRRHGLQAPAGDPILRAVLREARRTARPRRRPAPGAAQLTRMAGACPGDLAGLRDRALLLLAAAGLGRGALVGLDIEHIEFGHQGVTLQIVAVHGVMQAVTLPRAAERRLCPARVLEDWLRSSETRFGPVFRKIDRWGNLEHQRLGTDALRRILARRSLRRLRPRKAAA